MRALTVEPGKPHSIDLEDIGPPLRSDGTVLVRALAHYRKPAEQRSERSVEGNPPMPAEASQVY